MPDRPDIPGMIIPCFRLSRTCYRTLCITSATSSTSRLSESSSVLTASVSILAHIGQATAIISSACYDCLNINYTLSFLNLRILHVQLVNHEYIFSVGELQTQKNRGRTPGENSRIVKYPAGSSLQFDECSRSTGDICAGI